MTRTIRRLIALLGLLSAGAGPVCAQTATTPVQSASVPPAPQSSAPQVAYAYAPSFAASGLSVTASLGPLVAGAPGMLTLAVTDALPAGVGPPALAVSAPASASLAAPVSGAGLADTGVSASGATLAAGMTDANWSVVATPAGTLTAPQGTYAIESPAQLGARDGQPGTEVSPAPAQAAGGNSAPGNYTYQEAVTWAAPPASVVLRLGADDSVVSVSLNGVSQPWTPPSGSAMAPVTLTGWVAGRNVVQVVVHNALAVPNPVRLRAEWGLITGQSSPLAAAPALALTVGPQVLYRVVLPDWVSDLGGTQGWLSQVASGGSWYDSNDNGTSHTLNVILPVPAGGSQAVVSVPLIASPQGVSPTPLALSPSALTAP